MTTLSMATSIPCCKSRHSPLPFAMIADTTVHCLFYSLTSSIQYNTYNHDARGRTPRSCPFCRASQTGYQPGLQIIYGTHTCSKQGLRPVWPI